MPGSHSASMQFPTEDRAGREAWKRKKRRIEKEKS
jgi:hypothetical protein